MGGLHERDIALVVIAGAAIVLAVLSFFMPHRALMAGIGVLGIAALALAIVGIASPSVANRATELENELNRIVAGGATQTSVSADVGAYLALAGSAILAIAGIAGALTPGTKRCPDCAKAVPLEAHVCHHCCYRFESRTIYAPDPHNRDGG